MTCKVLVSGGMVRYLDAVDLVETTSESAIEGVVLGRVVQLIEILLVEEPLCRRPLDALRAMLVVTLLCPIGVDFHRLKGVHFWAESHKLGDWVPRHLVLHLPDHRLIRREPWFIVWIGGLVVGQVEVFLHINHVLVDVRCLDVIHQGVGICEEEMGLLPIPRLDDVVVEPIEYNYDFIR